MFAFSVSLTLGYKEFSMSLGETQWATTFKLCKKINWKHQFATIIITLLMLILYGIPHASEAPNRSS